MATALVALATTTLASSSASVTFAGIPGGYRDLRIVGTTSLNSIVTVYLNGDTTWANYARVAMLGNGSTTQSSSASDPRIFEVFGDSNFMIDILDYSATDKHKTGLVRENAPSTEVRATAWRWANTAAVTTVRLDASTWPIGTVISLYGIVG